MQLLKNKVVFLTGGTEGIGYECAKTYHKAGAKVSIITHKESSLQQCRMQFFNDNIHYILADVSNPADVQRAIEETISHFGKIDIIHNNAGVSSPSKTVCDTTDEEWDKVFNVNVKGIYHTTKFGIEALKQSRGTILNTGSLVGNIGQELHAAYTATKGAVNTLTKSMALDYAPFGIRVNAVAPAGVWTPMLRRWSNQQPNVAHIENYLDEIHPLGYCPEGDVVADACLFLISEQARFITGCILPVSGGAELGYRKYMGQQVQKIDVVLPVDKKREELMITKVNISDIRYPLDGNAGSDAIHRDPVYSYAVTQLRDDSGITGTGFAFTLGEGNDLVCKAAEYYARQLAGKDIEDTMANFGELFKKLSNDQQFRWLGPHKGVVHLALASVTNACYDLWAKKRGVPLWKLLTDLSPEQIVNTLDLSYLEDELTATQAVEILKSQQSHKEGRMPILENGYPGYDTSIGWFNYPDELVRENCKKALAEGFTAMKLKVGSTDPDRDIRRAQIVREVAGDNIKVMLDANQQWNLPQAISICTKLKDMNPYWIEEPTHPDDVNAHAKLAQAIVPVKLALGEHVPNKIIFKNYLQSGSSSFMQVDAVRVGGASEFITISLLCKKFGVSVVPHVGDMGQLHQHLVLFNHIAMGHEALFLEHIPHLQKHFVHPAQIVNGVYKTPQEAGSSCDLIVLKD